MAYPPFFTTDENLFSKLNAGVAWGSDVWDLGVGHGWFVLVGDHSLPQLDSASNDSAETDYNSLSFSLLQEDYLEAHGYSLQSEVFSTINVSYVHGQL